MPEEKKKPSEKEVDIDTSGPEVDVTVPEVKEEPVVTETETYEETTEGDVMPLESRKIWNVPPPSYIRLITS